MTTNVVKTIAAAAIAMALIVACIINKDNLIWAVPALTLVIGYITGNAKMTKRLGVFSPIFELPEKE